MTLTKPDYAEARAWFLSDALHYRAEGNILSLKTAQRSLARIRFHYGKAAL